jgi:hypothetical protein
MIQKCLAVAVIILFISVALAPSINAEIESNESKYTDFLDDGSLSGYVFDSNMEPIEGALVRVEFHSEYEENYTDSNGYYHVSNIPLCFCLKNCSASKVDYVTEWAYLEIIEETFYDFILEEDDDCGCDDNNELEFPIICSILDFLFEFVLLFSPFPVPLSHWIIISIAEKLGCPNIP